MKALLPISLSVLLCAVGARDFAPASAAGIGGPSIAWGPRAGTSDLSEVSGVADEFGPGLGEALSRAARAIPNGASQSSLTESGRTAREMKVEVVRDGGGNLVYAVTDGGGIDARAPGPSRQGFRLALFAGVPAGIEPDPSSYPHDLLGLWSRDSEVGVFWSASPSVPAPAFGNRSPAGRVVFSGDGVGLLSAGGSTTKFLADIEFAVDFDNLTATGKADGFRTFAGEALDSPSLSLDSIGFSPRGESFSGGTSARIAGGGRWGARWSDGEGGALGGTFGFATENGSAAVLAAFIALSVEPGAAGNPDDPVATSR